MSTALQVLNFAYRKANLDEITTFSTSLEFPANIAQDVINTAIREMNRWGSYWFMETDTALSYSVGIYQYTLSSLEIDPKRIISVRRTLTNYAGYLTQYQHNRFVKLFRFSATQTSIPTGFTKFGGVLELNTIPDRDYALKVKHYKDLPLVTTALQALVIPESDEDVLGDLCYAYLLQSMGKPDYVQAYEIAKMKAQSLLATMQEDAGIPLQMPAHF